MTDDYELVISALGHYSERLRKLLTDPEIITIATESLKKDLLVEAKLADGIKEKVKDNEVIIDPGTDATILEPAENKRIAESALKCYLNDLNSSKNLVRTKLGVLPKLDFLDSEINHCTEFTRRGMKL